MRRALGLLACACALALGALPLVGPAQAAGTGDPVILAPVAGQTLPYEWTGPIKVDFSNAPAGSYDVYVTCGEVSYFSTSRQTDESTGIVELPMSGPLGTQGACAAKVKTWEPLKVISAPFTVQPPMPVIVSPLAGSVQPVEWRGPITVDFTDAPAAEYWLSLDCTKGGLHIGFPTTEANTTRSFQTGYLAGDCSVHLARGLQQGAPVTFRVTPPPALTVSSPTLDHPTFYPRVRDGYLDSVSTAVTVNRRFTSAIQVLDSNGNTVRSASFPWREAGQLRWTWDGREDDGRLAWPGSYQFRIQVATWGDESKILRSPVINLATKTVWERKYVSKSGYYGTPSASTACSVARRSETSSAILRCWGGDHARMTYGFTLPSSAKNLAFGVAGRWTAADVCCTGNLRRVGSRPSATLYRVLTQVNGTRAYQVQRVTVGYDWLHSY